MKQAAEDLHIIVLSHGHGDHPRGLMGMIQRLGERKMPLLLHLHAFLQRKLVFPRPLVHLADRRISRPGR